MARGSATPEQQRARTTEVNETRCSSKLQQRSVLLANIQAHICGTSLMQSDDQNQSVALVKGLSEESLLTTNMSKLQGLRVLVEQFLSAAAEEIVEAVEKSKIQGFRVLVKQFLSVAADEIVEAVEKMILGYEEEMFQSKREISRQRKMLDAPLQPKINLNRIADVSSMTVQHMVVEPQKRGRGRPRKLFVPSPAEEERAGGEDEMAEEAQLTEQQQEWNSSPRQKNPESLQTERSHKEPLSSSQDRRPEDDTIHDTFTPQCVENEHEIDKEKEEPLPVTSAEQMPIETDEEVPSPVVSKAENGEDEDWQLSDASQDSDSDSSEANQDGDSDGSEEWSNSGQQKHTQTAKTPRMKKKLKSSIICKVCGKSFQAQVSLVNHLDIHPKDICGLCGRHFETAEDFKLHLKTHKNMKAKVCDICGKCFRQESYLNMHMRTHTGDKPYSCGVCGRGFSIRANMIRHLRTHTGEKPYSCKTCNKSFSEKRKRHKCLQEKIPAVTTPAVDNGVDNAEVKDSRAVTYKQRLLYICKVCEKECPSMVSFVNHAKTHTEDLLCAFCGTRSDSEESLKLHLQTHGDRIKVCEICGKQSSQMETHMRTHTGEKPFSCSVCGKSFSTRQNMTRHLRVHTGEMPFSCSTCNKRYTDYSGLKRHKCLQDKIPAVTTPAGGDGDGKAEVKDSTTNKQQSLYICKVCEKEFLSMVSLVNHATTHIEDLICGFCGTRSDSEESLKLHLKTHTSYRKLCEICGKCFSHKAHLEDHVRTHTGDKPFSCSVCGKSFGTNSMLIIHLRAHSEERPYSCVSCDKCFKSSTHLKQHMRVHSACATR